MTWSTFYEIIHIWTAAVDLSEEWSLQLIFQFKQMERRSLKKIRAIFYVKEHIWLLTKCEVKIAWYWPSYFFVCLWAKADSRFLECYYDQKFTSLFPSDSKSVLVWHLTGKIITFKFYPKAVIYECKFRITQFAIAQSFKSDWLYFRGLDKG